jgi:hypothetical protein
MSSKIAPCITGRGPVPRTPCCNPNRLVAAPSLWKEDVRSRLNVCALGRLIDLCLHSFCIGMRLFSLRPATKPQDWARLLSSEVCINISSRPCQFLSYHITLHSCRLSIDDPVHLQVPRTFCLQVYRTSSLWPFET